VGEFLSRGDPVSLAVLRRTSPGIGLASVSERSAPPKQPNQQLKGVASMITREELKGRWNEIRGQIKEKWGQLTDDDLRQAEGNTDQLIGLIQRKTGEGREQITKFFDTMAREGGDKATDVMGQAGQVMNQASETVQRYAQDAGKYAQDASRYVQEGYQQASRSMQEGVQQAEQTVRQRPVESLAVAFGTGVITGLLVALVMRSR
jgi:uncharacterized protein YjbJ (UPF0337 family)